MAFRYPLLLVFGILVALCGFSTRAQAQLYHVTINTDSLKGLGPYYIEFQLIDGAFEGNANATATITNFTLNGGSLGAGLPPEGNANGTLQDTLTLIDGPADKGVLADFTRAFTVTGPGSALHFDVQLNSTSIETLFLDSFAVLILDSSLTALATTGPFGTEMVSADFSTTAPVPVGHASTQPPLLSAVVAAAAPGLSSVTLSTFTTCAPLAVTGTVKLNTPAPPGGRVVTLTSSRPGVASVPANVTVPAGAKSVPFTVQTFGVASDTDATLTATASGVARTVTLTVQPLLQSLTLSAPTTTGAQTLTGTVTLRCPLPGQAMTVLLQSGHPNVQIPASVSIPATQTATTFPITVSSPEAAAEIFLYARAAGATNSTVLAVVPDPTYTLTDLGTLGGQNSYATSINEAGQIVGYANTASGDTRAFRFINGTLTDLNTLGGQHSYAYAINAESAVAGESDTAIGALQAFLFAGTMTGIDTLGGQNSYGRALNLYGQVAGFAQTSTGDEHAFLLRADGLVDLGTLGGQNSRAFGVTDLGVVIGEAETGTGSLHGFQYQNGTMTDLGTLGGDKSTAYAINAIGQVAGQSETPLGETHAFLYRKGAMRDLGTPGGQNSTARALNALGQVVGTGQNAQGEPVAFLATEMLLHDLNERVTNLADWTLTTAMSINEAGQIVGCGTLFGNTHAFLLTPVPPASPLRKVSGTVALEECVHCAHPLTLTFRAADGSPLFRQTRTLLADGKITLKDIPADSFQLAVDGDRWLQRVSGVNTTSGNVTTLSLRLLGGDANGDNSVDVLDLDALIQAFDSMAGAPNWNPLSDFNADGSVDVLDLDLLIRNFDAQGDA